MQRDNQPVEQRAPFQVVDECVCVRADVHRQCGGVRQPVREAAALHTQRGGGVPKSKHLRASATHVSSALKWLLIAASHLSSGKRRIFVFL